VVRYKVDSPKIGVFWGAKHDFRRIRTRCQYWHGPCPKGISCGVSQATWGEWLDRLFRSGRKGDSNQAAGEFCTGLQALGSCRGRRNFGKGGLYEWLAASGWRLSPARPRCLLGDASVALGIIAAKAAVFGGAKDNRSPDREFEARVTVGERQGHRRCSCLFLRADWCHCVALVEGTQ